LVAALRIVAPDAVQDAVQVAVRFAEALVACDRMANTVVNMVVNMVAETDRGMVLERTSADRRRRGCLGTAPPRLTQRPTSAATPSPTRDQRQRAANQQSVCSYGSPKVDVRSVVEVPRTEQSILELVCALGVRHNSWWTICSRFGFQSEGLRFLSPGRAVSATPWVFKYHVAVDGKALAVFQTAGREPMVPREASLWLLPWANESQSFGLKTNVGCTPVPPTVVTHSSVSWACVTTVGGRFVHGLGFSDRRSGSSQPRVSRFGVAQGHSRPEIQNQNHRHPTNMTPIC
jgi:hypothetical protein